MAPSRQGDMARIAIRTLFSATIACFMTASIAGKCPGVVAFEERNPNFVLVSLCIAWRNI